MSTVKDFANQHGLMLTVRRAMSFHPQHFPDATSSLWSIPVEYSAHLQTSAGYFHCGPPMKITLHYGLQRSALHELHETFLHELAHAMQWIRYAKVDHNATWWEMMHQLGAHPVRTHKIAACRPATNRLTVKPGDIGL